ncbi:glycoside hydrolase family 25 protein [soil metagenome]
MAKSTVKKKKSTWRYVPFIIAGLICVYIALQYWWQQRAEDRARFSMYPGFGIKLPSQYEIHGIDISIFQQAVYWPSVKKMQVKDVKVGFVFIKATEGLLNTDKQFKRNWQKAKENNVPRGAYHFFLATKDGKAQANNFIKRVQLEPGDLPPVLDIEQLYGVQPELMRKRIKDWLHTVEAAYDVKPIIYSSADFYNRYLGEDFDDYPLWVAHYFEQKKPRVEREWQFWQHSSIGHINGIATNVDFNVFNGDSTDFKAMLLK